MRTALLIFVKNPALGKVKTRLAKTIGDKNALKIYQFLLDHTNEITFDLDMEKFVYYSDYIPTKDEWSPMKYQKELQKGAHLGEKMNNAFKQAFDEGNQKVLLIMPDCPKMSDAIIDKAFKSLDNHDVVIGPTNDGGFYAIGMSKYVSQVFDNKTYETATLYEDTVQTIEKANCTYFKMQELVDVDTEEDLGKLKKMINME